MGCRNTELFLIWTCQVWQGNYEEEEALLATGCGTSAPDPVIAPNNIVTTVFQSRDAPGRGFSASFISSKWHLSQMAALNFHFGLVYVCVSRQTSVQSFVEASTQLLNTRTPLLNAMGALYASVLGLTNGPCHSHKLFSEEMTSQDLCWLLLCFVIFAVHIVKVTVLGWAYHFFFPRECVSWGPNSLEV